MKLVNLWKSTIILSSMVFASSFAWAETLKLVLKPDPPVLGKQELEIKVFDGKGKESSSAKVDMQAIMPEMQGMSAMTSKGKMEKKSSGVFDAKFNLSMEGTWYLKISVDENGKTENFIYEITTGIKGMKAVKEVPHSVKEGGGMDHSHH